MATIEVVKDDVLYRVRAESDQEFPVILRDLHTFLHTRDGGAISAGSSVAAGFNAGERKETLGRTQRVPAPASTYRVDSGILEGLGAEVEEEEASAGEGRTTVAIARDAVKRLDKVYNMKQLTSKMLQMGWKTTSTSGRLENVVRNSLRHAIRKGDGFWALGAGKFTSDKATAAAYGAERVT